MNKIINKLLLAGDKFMPKMHGDERHDEYQIGLTFMVCKFFDKNTLVKLCQTNN